MSELPLPERPREPAFNLPGIVTACCVVLLGLHALRAFLSPETDDRLIAVFAFVPARMAIALGIAQHQVQIAVQNVPLEQLQQLIGGGWWWTLVTYALLHGSWAHVGFNCVWLVAFGAPVARRFSASRFLLLLVVAAVVGALLQFLWSPASFIPVIGASAAVAGAMGAATRFVFRPDDEAMRFFDRAKLNEAFRRPALTLVQTFTTKGALVFVVLWFVTNLVFGLFPALSGISADGPIAWQAHIGGFLAGLLLFPLFDPPQPAAMPALDTEDSADLPLSPTEEGPR